MQTRDTPNDFPGKSGSVESVMPFVAAFPEHRGSSSISLDFSSFVFETCPFQKLARPNCALIKAAKTSVAPVLVTGA